MTRTCGSYGKTKIWKAVNACNAKKKFCVLQKKVLSFGPNRTVEVQPSSSAKPNVWLVTTLNANLIWEGSLVNSYVQHDLFASNYHKIGLKFLIANTLSSGWQCCDMKFPLYSTSNNVLGMCAETMEPWKQRSSKRKLKSIHSMKRTKFGVLSKFEF